MRTITEIISDCGGIAKIEEAAKGELSHWAVRKWPAIGIPEKNWSLIRSLVDIAPEELHAANEAVRASRESAA